MRTKKSAADSDTPYIISTVFTAKCQEPAPFGVGTSTAIHPTAKLTRAHDSDNAEVSVKQKNVR